MNEDFFDAVDARESGPLLVPTQVIGSDIPEPRWLYKLATEVLGHNEMRPQPHYEICNALEEAVGDCTFKRESQYRLMIGVPRGAFKTTIATHALTVGILAKNPNARILIDSHRLDVSMERLEAIKYTFEEDTKFHAMFGEGWKSPDRSRIWTAKKITVDRRTVNLKEASVDTGGVDSAKTGSHYDCILVDDIVHESNIGTPAMREKVYKHYGRLMPLLEPGGTLIILFTRWHTDDAYGKIIREDERLIKAGEEPLFKKIIRSCWDGPNGLYFPSRQTAKVLKDLQSTMTPYEFSCQYENSPIAATEKTFKMQYLQEKEFYWRSDNRGNHVELDDKIIPVNTTMTWDTAGSKATSGSDYHGLTIVGTDAQDSWWVPIAEGVKGSPMEIVDRVVMLCREYQPDELYIEAIGTYEHWVGYVQPEFDRLRISTRIRESKPGSQSKLARISMLEPKWTARKITLQKGLNELVRQLDAISPQSLPDHDDVADALSMHLGHTNPAPEQGAIVKKVDMRYDKDWLEKQKSVFSHPYTTKWRV